MTKKDFELIAGIIGGMTYLSMVDCGTIAEDFADALATTNAAFDRVRFLAACGVI